MNNAITVNVKAETLANSARELLEKNILRFWADKMYDPKGGFYGRMDGKNILHPEAERGAVMNARLLWSFSAAYRVLREPKYLEMANHAKAYIEAHFIDREFGGVFWSLTADGKPLDTKKQSYAIGFMIYAFSEYTRATGDPSALKTAIALFEALEAHAYDAENQGYVEALTREWQPIGDMRLSDKDENAEFTMNTHLHILEPYTNLYRVWPDSRLRSSLLTLIRIFTDRLFNPTNGHLDCFFDRNWQGRRNIASYGHDIEAAWLLNEALAVLGDDQLSVQVIPVTTRIAHASEEGLQPDGSMIHEKKEPDGRDDSRQWWVLCEAVIGFIDQWQCTHEQRYWKMASDAYHYIINHLVDYEQGEWYWAVLPDGTIDTTGDKAGFWKCPYHNSRMCLEILERF